MNRITGQGRARRRWAVLAGGAAAAGLAATVVLTVPAGADERPAGPTATASGDHPRLCERLERVQDRGQRLITRLEGGAGTRGSIAWLEVKAQEASAAGDTEAASRFSERAAWRSDVLERILVVAPELDALIAEHCA